MSIENLMTTELVTVEMDDSLERVKTLFDTHGFHHLLVVEEGRLFGVVSDRDLLKAMSPKVGSRAMSERDEQTLKTRVHRVMTRQPITLPPHASVRDAMEIFVTERVSCIPVVDDGKHPVGIVSWRDILRVMLEKIREVETA